MLFLLSNIFYYVGIPCIIVGSILIILIIYLLIKHFQKRHYYLERSKAHSEVLTCLGGIENVMSCKAVGSRLSLVLKDYNLVAYEETAKQHEHGELFHTLQQLKAGDQLLIIVGCEGGFDESEIQELNEMGVKCCSLGNRILRSETAPLYLMSVIGYSRELTK